MNQYRCRFDYFNDKSKLMCSNWDCFFNSCKLTWYETTLEGKKQTIHPHLSSEKLWIIEQVGCASHSDFQSERDTVLDVGGILESLCKTDLYWYNKGVTEGEDVGICRGKDCNYCGRYNEKLRHQAGEP